MMDQFELLNDMNALQKRLTEAIPDLARYGRELADAEAKYKIALMKMSLQLKDQGMAVTMIDKVVYGYVAEERRERDIAEAYYKTAQENINAIKLRIRIIDNQIGREWGNA